MFSGFLDDINEGHRTGYQDTKIWQSLYNFQRDAATGIINKLETYNGCILADSVGLGKTFMGRLSSSTTSCATKACSSWRRRKLAENWTSYHANLTTNLFASDRFNYGVLAHTDLSRTRGESLGLRLDRINWGKLRPGRDRSQVAQLPQRHISDQKESVYQRLMRQVIQDG